MAVFKEIVNNEQLANAGLVVFFNKTGRSLSTTVRCKSPF